MGGWVGGEGKGKHCSVGSILWKFYFAPEAVCISCPHAVKLVPFICTSLLLSSVVMNLYFF